MVAIVGYSSGKEAASIILEGLKALEYRGYGSAGIATINGSGRIERQRAVGKLDNLINVMQGETPASHTGIGHTRWATHGEVTVDNAHPHVSCSKDIAVVHNGIVENHSELRDQLMARGHRFESQTDTEVIPHLIEEQLNQGNSLVEACRLTFRQLQGSQAVVVLWQGCPDTLVTTRIGDCGGIAIAKRQGEVLVASDISALLDFSNEVLFLKPGEIAVASPDQVKVMDLAGNSVASALQQVTSDLAAPTKDGYEHFTLKEIMGQANTVQQAFYNRVQLEPGSVNLEDFPFSEEQVLQWDRVVILAMGTSYYAAQVGRFYFEQIAGIPTEVENASEFRYRDPLINDRTLVVSISQSGETADTLAGMDEARKKGAKVITLCNVPWSQSTRAADYTLYLRAGIERGVASTKCFTSSLVCLYLLAVHLGLTRGKLTQQQVQRLVTDLTQVPAMIHSLLEEQEIYREIAAKFVEAEHFFYLGRGINCPLAMEGALKLKEISYIHAEGYPAGEMKHGPIALIQQDTPVLAIALQGTHREKMLSNVAEMKARGAHVVTLSTRLEDGSVDDAVSQDVIGVPPASELLAPVVASVPLQLLAYHIALLRGCDVDMPKNLAKSVTVE